MNLDDKNKKKDKFLEEKKKLNKWFHCFKCKQSYPIESLGYVHYDLQGFDRLVCFSCAKTRFFNK